MSGVTEEKYVVACKNRWVKNDSNSLRPAGAFSLTRRPAEIEGLIGASRNSGFRAGPACHGLFE